MIGYALGGALLPALIAYLIAGRKSVRNFNRWAVWFSGLCVLFLAIGKQPVSLEQHTVDLAREAAGTKPVDNSGPQAMDDLVRDMVRDVLEARKAVDRDMARFNPALGKLYTSESFASVEAMRGSVEAVQGAVAVDQRYSQQLDTLPERIQARLGSSASSDSIEFMQGVRKAYGDSEELATRRRAIDIEKQWADATVSFYEFAIANATKIRAKKGSHLEIANAKLLAEFNDRMQKSRALRDSLMALNQQVEKAQSDALRRFGVTPKDVGLEDVTQPAKK